MSWNTLQTQAKSMGFKVSFRTRRDKGGGLMPEMTPPEGRGWILVGCYDNAFGFWVKPLTDSACKLKDSRVRKLMADFDPFVGTVGEYDVDYFNADARLLVALQNLHQVTDDHRGPLKSGMTGPAVHPSRNESADLLPA